MKWYVDGERVVFDLTVDEVRRLGFLLGISKQQLSNALGSMATSESEVSQLRDRLIKLKSILDV